MAKQTLPTDFQDQISTLARGDSDLQARLTSLATKVWSDAFSTGFDEGYDTGREDGENANDC